MGKKDPYREFLEQDFSRLFEMLDLKDAQKQYMRSRWLDQVLWMEGRAGKSRDRYYRLRLISIIGGVIVPILVGLNINDQRMAATLRNITIGLSTVVAVSAAVEEFFHYGERWRHYRRSVETLKTQGWQFSQLTGPYASYRSHSEAFNVFASQVEDIIQKDVEMYATQITQPNKQEEEPDKSNRPASSYAAVEVSPAPPDSAAVVEMVPVNPAENAPSPESDLATRGDAPKQSPT